MEHPFVTYIRTKTVFQHRLKDLKTYDIVRIYMYELTKLGVKGQDLHFLREQGEIWYDDVGRFKALKSGPIDPKLLEQTRKWGKTRVELTDLHRYMKKQLVDVTIDVPLSSLPTYFRAFMEHRKDNLDLFFSVDGFSGRVHTPVVNLKGNLRKLIKLRGKFLCSLDVKQMQPTILAKILLDKVGINPFSTSVFDGKDVYLVLMHQHNMLQTRDEAKKFLYQLIFGKPMEDIGSLFTGDTTWVDWINHYKSNHEDKNPHSRDRHTNLAWLLQSQEVSIMARVWQQFMEKNIPFLTIHDEVLVRKRDKGKALTLFSNELKQVFPKFEINVTCYQE
jgi:hypothetical protein